MRSVAPHRPGSAASQNSSLVENLKPTLGRFTTTTLHTIHTAKASVSDGIEIQRLRVATARPSRSQKAASSGAQRVRTWVAMARPVRVSGVVRGFGMPAAFSDAHRPHLGEVHPHQRYPDDAEHQHEGRGAHTRQVHQRAEHDGQDEAAHPARQTDYPRDHADVVRIIVGDVLEHRGLAYGKRNAHGEHEDGEYGRVEADMKVIGSGGGRNNELAADSLKQALTLIAYPQYPPGY